MFCSINKLMRHDFTFLYCCCTLYVCVCIHIYENIPSPPTHCRLWFLFDEQKHSFSLLKRRCSVALLHPLLIKIMRQDIFRHDLSHFHCFWLLENDWNFVFALQIYYVNFCFAGAEEIFAFSPIYVVQYLNNFQKLFSRCGNFILK